MAEPLAVALRQDGPIPLDIDVVVGANQTLALVGASGAGKTTILRSIAGLYRPRHGRIACGGETWLDTGRAIDRPARARRVGFVFQSYALFPHLTALGNVMEAMVERADRRNAAIDLLARVHLERLGDRYPSALSGGQKQRVALARALARSPKVLLLDEPFSAVDHPTRKALHRLLAEIRATARMPIVFVSHDVEDAAHGADQVCLVQNGRGLEAGLTQEMLGNPSSQLAQWLTL